MKLQAILPIGAIAVMAIIPVATFAARGEAAAAETAAATPSDAPAANFTWQEFSGFKRYHANCSVCHGPDGLGGTFAPNLTKSLTALTKDQFLETVVNGKQSGQLAMPAFGTDPNVICFADDIYTYLKGRSDGRLGRGRPDPQPKKPADVAAQESACLGV